MLHFLQITALNNYKNLIKYTQYFFIFIFLLFKKKNCNLFFFRTSFLPRTFGLEAPLPGSPYLIIIAFGPLTLTPKGYRVQGTGYRVRGPKAIIIK